jgi:hypothetical protein
MSQCHNTMLLPEHVTVSQPESACCWHLLVISCLVYFILDGKTCLSRSYFQKRWQKQPNLQQMQTGALYWPNYYYLKQGFILSQSCSFCRLPALRLPLLRRWPRPPAPPVSLMPGCSSLCSLQQQTGWQRCCTFFKCIMCGNEAAQVLSGCFVIVAQTLNLNPCQGPPAVDQHQFC